MQIEAVVFDMDGVLVDSEGYWMKARQDFAHALGKTWTDEDHRCLMGTSTYEWGAIMKNRLDIAMPVHDIVNDIKQRVNAQYQQRMPLLAGVVEAVQLASQHYRVALASGSPREIITRVLQITELAPYFEVVVSGDDVQRGKPSPDIYLESLRQLRVSPQNAIGIEDSANGLKSLKAADMTAVAVLNPAFPLSDEALATADAVLNSLTDFSLVFVSSIRRVGQ
jgi:mannitol-1-/sugar-/sorbitol-6-/2-deoxyglucose-6-phosphatase